MRKRGAKEGRPADGPSTDGIPGLGVGVQVYVREREQPAADDWVGEPTGVIVAPGDRNLRNVYGPADGFTTWTVSFFEPQRRRDGRGPFERAVIPAALLVAEEPLSD
ncbi:hypothetical protein [Leifsonia shinshuensis]|uniref:hypothetical protein n=1 Tax=Leifsonia shinshuensis TaxID=150026 RepID=UPI0028555486|nr:hypothetical protein [Leifsonia shinshuensis]MDR6970292.1 hypothetical protein [Leifsonia shinshuensis]